MKNKLTILSGSLLILVGLGHITKGLPAYREIVEKGLMNLPIFKDAGDMFAISTDMIEFTWLLSGLQSIVLGTLLLILLNTLDSKKLKQVLRLYSLTFFAFAITFYLCISSIHPGSITFLVVSVLTWIASLDKYSKTGISK